MREGLCQAQTASPAIPVQMEQAVPSVHCNREPENGYLAMRAKR